MKTRIQKYNEFISTGCTAGEAFEFAHKLWDEENANDVEELYSVADQNLLFLYWH